MSTRALHALTVRLLADADFRAAVYADPDRALAGEPISVEERRWFVEVDRRAWEIDPLRNARLLTAFLDEYRITAIALAQAGWKVRQLHAFFRSPAFHEAVNHWTSLFLAVPVFLRSKLHARRDNAIVAMLSIDEAIVKVRRAPFERRPFPGPGHVRLAPTAAAAIVPGGALALWEVQHQALAQAGPAAAAVVAHLLGDRPRPGAMVRIPPFSSRSLQPSDPEGILVTATATSEPAIAIIGEGLAVWLRVAEQDVSRTAFITHALEAGLDIDEVQEIMKEMVDDGTLLNGA